MKPSWLRAPLPSVFLSFTLLLAIPSVLGAQPQGSQFDVFVDSDEIDDNPGDGICRTPSGYCTLRAAVMEANAFPGADLIRVPSGLYVLNLTGASEDTSATGDLDILEEVSIVGDGIGMTAIDATPLGDRTFHVLPGVTFHLSGVSFWYGDAGGESGGGLYNENGIVTITQSDLEFNRAGAGAGTMNAGEMTLLHSVVGYNTAADAAGGIWNEGTLTIDASTIAENKVLAGPSGGIHNRGTLVLRNSTVAQNRARNGAAGIFNGASAAASINNATINYNLVDPDGSGLPSSGGILNEDGGSVRISNSILAINADDWGVPDADCLGTIESGGYNLFGALTDCTLTGDRTGDLVGVDPLLPGVPTLDPVMTWGYPPLPESPAIDAGNPNPPGSSQTACEPDDQRSLSRPQGAACDIGAYEVEGPTPTDTPTEMTTGTPTPTDTPSPTSTSTSSPTVTNSPTPIVSPSTPTITPTGTLPTWTPSFTMTASATHDWTLTPSRTATETPSPTRSPIPTSTSTLGPLPYWTVGSEHASGALFGFSVAGRGDVNGDGFADILVGARDQDAGFGAAYLFLGSPSGPSTVASWSVEGDTQFASLGNDVDFAGDVNGDGYDDLLVASHQYTHGDTEEGRAFVYYGSPEGPATTADWTAEGNQYRALFSWSVAGVGDVNGDGYADILVGARYFDNGETDEGAAFLFTGSAAGLSAEPAWRVEGQREDAGMGYAVAGAGDVNGDGFDDVLVGAANTEPFTNYGAVYLFLGSAGGLAAAPVWSFENVLPNDGVGMAVDGAGDVNRDGFDDFLVGAPGSAYDGVPGRAYLYYGSPSGPGLAPGWVGGDATVSSRFGSDVAAAGDVNADGFGDVVIGAPSYYTGGSYGIVGQVSVYLGTSQGLQAEPAWRIRGQNNSAFGHDVGPVTDANGDSFGDFVIGAPMWSNQPFGKGRAFVFFGWALAYEPPPPTPGPSPTPWMTKTPSPTSTHTPSVTATETATPTFTITPSLTPTATPPPIFADGFETGDLTAWSSSQADSGNLAVTGPAAIGGNYGLQAVIDDNHSIYVVDTTPASETSYRVRFYFDPNGIAMASGESHVLLAALNIASVQAFRLEMRSYQGDYQIRAVAPQDETAAYVTSWTPLTNAPHFIEIEWQAASGAYTGDGSLVLYLDSEEPWTGTRGGLDNDTKRVDAVRLGAVSGVDGGTRGTYFFDAFVSTRGFAIGPDPSIHLPAPPPLEDLLFADDFESAGLAAWSARRTDGDDLRSGVSAGIYSPYGMEAVIDDTNPIYVTDWTPYAEPEYRARFYLDPSNLAMLNAQSLTVLQALMNPARVVAQIDLKSFQGDFQLRASFYDEQLGWMRSDWVTVRDEPHVLEILWKASSGISVPDGSAIFWIDREIRFQQGGFATQATGIDYVRLGAVAGIDAGTQGSLYFDAFESRRYTDIGPGPDWPEGVPPSFPPEEIFTDDFESGDLSRWSASQLDDGDLAVSPEAALHGGLGMQAVLDDGHSIYVTDWSPYQEASYRVQFSFDPNSLSMANGEAFTLLQGLMHPAASLVRLEMRFAQNTYQLRASFVFADGLGWHAGPWIPISDEAHSLELLWQAFIPDYAARGELWIDGTLVFGLDSEQGGFWIDYVRWGVVSGVDANTRGTVFFDDFVSWRNVPVGPLPPP